MQLDSAGAVAAGLRGRPLGFDRGRLDDALMLAFWELGWNGASYAVLEQRTGVARSSLGNTVGAKPALMAAAMERYLVVIDERLFAPLRDGDAGLDDIRSFFHRLREGKRTEPGRWGCLMAIAMTEIGAGDAEVSRLTGEYRSRLGAAFTAALGRAGIPSTLAPALVATAIGLNVAARAGASDAELDAVVAGANALLAAR